MTRIIENTKPVPRLALNVGGGLDLITGVMMKGKYGEDIIVGGFSNLQGEMGNPNSHKTTIALWMAFSALDTVAYSYMSELVLYDAEGTLRVERINELSKRYKYLNRDEDNNVIMNFSNIGREVPEEWFDKTFSKYIKNKRESKEYEIEIEFIKDPNTNKTLVVKLPTVTLLDTITMFDPSTTTDSILEVGSNEGKNKTFGLNNNKFKTDVMSTMTASTLRTNTYALIVAHVGDNINMDTNPYGPKQRKQIDSLASNEKIKGVPSNYTRILTSLWQATSKKFLNNPVTMLAEYPLNNGQDKVKNELQLITLKQHRSKDNMSDVFVQLIVSQKEGVLPHLSQFHYLKEEKYGFEGNKLSYALVLYPECKIGRTTVRPKIDEDPKLRRALELTSDYLQLQTYYPHYGDLGYFCTLEELYKDIDALGYDWNKILTLTRNWWTPKQYTSELKYLNILNLLKIRKGLYEYHELLSLISKEKTDVIKTKS